MSEDHPIYETGNPQISPGTLLKFNEAGYTPPTASDVRALKELSGKTGSELAALVGLKDARNFRKWTAPPEAAQKAAIPYSAWRLLLLELKLVAL